MRSKQRIPKWEYVFLMGLLSVMCTAFLGCATDTDFAKFAKISPPILVLLDPDGEGVDTEPNLVAICMGGKPRATPDVDIDDLLIIKKKPSDSVGDGDGAGLSSNVDLDKESGKTANLEREQFEYLNLPVPFGTRKFGLREAVSKDYSESIAGAESELIETEPDDEDMFPSMIAGPCPKFSAEPFVGLVPWTVVDTEPEPDDTETDFKNGSVGSSEKKPAINKAGFGMPTTVGLVLFALLLCGAKHRVVKSVLVTSQLPGVERNGSGLLPSFMMNCKNDSEDTYEARREVRLQRRYRAYVEAFQEIGSDPAIREYLLTRLCEEIPRKKELIRKAFEYTAKAA